MPACKKCTRVSATAELRRSPKGGYMCRDQGRCTARQKHALAMLPAIDAVIDRLEPQPCHCMGRGKAKVVCLRCELLGILTTWDAVESPAAAA